MKRRDSEAGFALVESIGALLVGTLVVAALALTLGLVVRSSAAVARRANTTEVLVSGLAALRRELAGALPLAAGRDPKAPVLFRGTPGAVGFATDTEIVWIEAAALKNGGALIRSARPALPGASSLGAAESAGGARLLSGPWTFRFTYAAFDEANGNWTGEWIARSRLPDLVRLDVLDAGGRGNPLLSLVAAPRVRRDRRCAFDEPGSCAPTETGAASP